MFCPSFDTLYKRCSEHRYEILTFTLILLVGIFFRTYHFSSWLHFEVDQTYDFNIVSRAVENGIGNLPLLGPTAGGGRALRLGPGFYYLEYGAAKIFGNTAQGHAMVILLSSIATLPLFYFFSRRYFSKGTALFLMSIFAVSCYSVLYSRFSWSPNILPFLILLSFYALLRSTAEDEPHKNLWFLLMTAATTLTTQIHFNAFFTIPAIVIAYLLIKRPRLSLITWALALTIILIIYAPVIASDIKTHGENLHLFEAKLLKASGSTLENPPLTVLRDVEHNALGYFFIVTGVGDLSNKTIPSFTLLNTNLPPQEMILNLLTLLFFVTSLFLLVRNLLLERIPAKRDFLFLISLWFLFSFLYFFSIIKGYRMYPRFFLLVSPLAIIFLGFIISALSSKKSLWGIATTICISVALISTNISRIITHFDQLASGERTATEEPASEDIFPDTSRVTFRQEQAIVDYMFSKTQANGFPIYFSSKSEYEPAFWYGLEKHGISYYDTMRDDILYKEANYFIITLSSGRQRVAPPYQLIERKEFGSLTVLFVKPTLGTPITLRQGASSRTTSEETRNIAALLTWNTLFKK